MLLNSACLVDAALRSATRDPANQEHDFNTGNVSKAAGLEWPPTQR
jgi:hypothetical protein